MLHPRATIPRDDAGSAGIFGSLLASEANVRTPELHVGRIELHRHGAEHPAMERRDGRWCRSILYLSGWGQRMFSSECADVTPGLLVMLPAGQRNSLHPALGRPPLCLVIEFQLRQRRAPEKKVCLVSRDNLAQTREQIGRLLRMQSGASGMLGWESAAIVLEITIRLLRAAGWLDPVAPVGLSESGSAMHRLLLTMDLESPLQQTVGRSGYQRDHLNRLVKKETGLTLGQFRAQRRLARAKELLAQGIKVGDVADSVGLPDPSYFARWFRRQTGRSPSHWLRQGEGAFDGATPLESGFGFTAATREAWSVG
jgi:AraC family L-rhamnose operon transcriptional activator RhaR